MLNKLKEKANAIENPKALVIKSACVAAGVVIGAAAAHFLSKPVAEVVEEVLDAAA